MQFNMVFGRAIIASLVAATTTAVDIPNPVPESLRPDAIKDIHIYGDFYDSPELYRRVNVILDHVERKQELGWWWRWGSSPEAYVTLSTSGDDTGSAEDYFDIGSYKTKTSEADNDSTDGVFNPLFSWDEKALLLYKKSGTNAIDITIFDEDFGTADDLLLKFSLPITDLPEPGQGYVEYRRSHSSPESQDYDEMEGAELIFRIKVSEMSDPFISRAMIDDSKSSIEGEVTYGEHVLELDVGEKALVQSWTHDTSKCSVDGAVLWVIGRNDGYFNPKLLDLFRDGGDTKCYDVFLLNWRRNSISRARGWVDDAFMVSHVKDGNFEPYTQEIEKTLDYMKTFSGKGGYSNVLGYAFSTGAPILLNYLLENGDYYFDGFLFNSPFLDWGQGGTSELGEFAENMLSSFVANFYGYVGHMSDLIYGVQGTPKEVGKDINYLKRSIKPRNKVAKTYSQCRLDWIDRPMYHMPVSAGFAVAATKLLEKIDNAGVITSKPMLVLTSDADTTLTGSEISALAKEVNPNCEQEHFRYNAHDVFNSYDEEDSQRALDAAKDWLEHEFQMTKIPSRPSSPTETSTKTENSSFDISLSRQNALVRQSQPKLRRRE